MTIGGGLFGVAGMILGTPVFAIIYILLGRATRAREGAAKRRRITDASQRGRDATRPGPFLK